MTVFYRLASVLCDSRFWLRAFTILIALFVIRFAFEVIQSRLEFYGPRASLFKVLFYGILAIFLFILL